MGEKKRRQTASPQGERRETLREKGEKMMNSEMERKLNRLKAICVIGSSLLAALLLWLFSR
jgi:hypothetical protein